MAWETGDALNHTDFLARLRRFLSGRPTFGTVVKTGVGNGTLINLDGGPNSVTETWTVECITEVLNGGIFSVTGSVSGALPDATVGTPYVNALINFLITDGTTDFEVGTTFVFTATIGATKVSGQQWEIKRSDATTLMVMGKGLAGTDEIYVNLSMFVNAPADIYNMVIQGAVGYNPANPVNDQPSDSRPIALTLWNNPMKYWFIANSRRFICVVNVSSSYVASYCGFILPYATPSQFPYPLFVGANMGNYRKTNQEVSGAWNTRNYAYAGFTGFTNSNYWCPVNEENGHYFNRFNELDVTQSMLYWFDGDWKDFSNGFNGGYSVSERIDNCVLPINPTIYREGIDGTYELQPHQLTSLQPKGILGELDGSFFISGFSNGSENTVTIGGSTYLVVQNVNRNGVDDFAAIKLE